MAYIFDLDGTLVDSKAKTIAAYEEAAPGLFKPAYWGRSAVEWNCPPAVHRAKQTIFCRNTDLLDPGWALPMLEEVLRRGEQPVLLTSASEQTAKFLHRYLKTLIGDFIFAEMICSASYATKIETLSLMASHESVHYYDDQTLVGLPSGVFHHTDAVLPTTSVVVVAAGRGSRFRAAGISTSKPLLLYRNRPLVDYALRSAQEITTVPVLVTTPEVISDAVEMIAVVVVEVHRLQPGPVASALLAATVVSEDDPVIFLDSDVVLPPGSVYDLAAGCAANTTLMASALMANRGLRAGSYGGVDRHNLVVEASLDCPLCNVGAYWFSSFGAFRQLAARALVLNPNSELKFSHLLALADPHHVLIDSAGWLPLGTPEELTTAIRGTHD